MFGVDSGRNVDLNLFLLLVKSFIWKQSKQESILTTQLFLRHLKSFHSVQSCVYNMNGKSKEFKALWYATAKTVDVLGS